MLVIGDRITMDSSKAKIVDRFLYSPGMDVGEFFTQNYRTLRSYVLAIRSNPADTQDLMQEVAYSFIKYDTLNKYNPKLSHLNTYISKALRRAVFNYLMRPVNKHPPVDGYGDYEDLTIPSEDAILDFVTFVKWYRSSHVRPSRRTRLRDLRIVKLALGGLSIQGIAMKLSISPQRVYQQLKFVRRYYVEFMQGDFT